MQQADQRSQGQEIRISLHQHSLDLVNLCIASPSLLLSSLIKSVRHTRKYLEFEVRHWLEDNLEGESRRGAVDFDVLGAEVPEFVGEDDREVIACSSGRVSLALHEANIWKELSSDSSAGQI